MITTDQVQSIIGGTVVGSDDDKIGKVGQVYLDDETGQPDWVTVNTGLFGTSETFIPLSDATISGDTLRVPFSKDKVKGAPRVDADGHLEESEERELYRYYGLEGRYNGVDAGYTGGDVSDRDVSDRDVSDRDATVAAGTTGTVGHDTSGPTTDNAMTRSEEQLRVGTQRREAGRARLRKYVVTETETATVPVSREEVRVEREPITDANAGAALDGPAISEEEHEVVLHEEVPVTSKEARPVERVRLDAETVTEQVTVSDEVRKEQIEVDAPRDADRRA